MIYPDYFDNNETEEKIINLYRQLEDFILNDIANRLLKNSSMTATADHLIWRLQQMGESREEIMQKLQEITKLSRSELRTLLQDAVLTSWEDEKPFYDSLGALVSNPLENAEIIRIMDAQYKKSLGELSNLTRTTMEQSQIDLMNMLSEMDMQIAFGIKSPTTAVCEILDRYAGQGIEVLYPTGTKRTLEAAVRCCITTSAMQMTGQITAQYIAQYGVEYVCTSAHIGARVQGKGQPELAGHDNWQGKIFKIVGSEPGFPNLLESTGYNIDINTGIGKVENLLGLYGYNCKHGAKPCRKDYENPWRDKDGNLIIGGERIDSEKNRKAYEVSQKARYMERSIRETKRKLLMKETEINGVAETDVRDILQPEYDKLAYRLRMQNKQYNEFCEVNGVKKEYDRIKKSGFGRKQSAKANGAATRYQNTAQNKDDPGFNRQQEKMQKEIAKSKKDGIIKSRNMSDVFTGGKRNETPLEDKEIEAAKAAAKRQGYLGDIHYSNNSNTSFHGSIEGKPYHYLVIGTDAFPAKQNGGTANERISLDGCMAHEIVGHYEAWKKGTTQKIEVLEEVQASLRASKFGVGLTDDEREILKQDAIDRLNAAGINLKDIEDSLDIWER